MINKWTKAEESKLINIMIDNEFTYHNAPWKEIASKFENRTPKSIQAKVGRLLNSNPNIFDSKYEWSSDEIKKALKYYLEGESFSQIHQKLGSKVSIEELEEKMLEMKSGITKQLYTYAEERGLKVKHVSLDLLKFFIQNRNTTSQLARAGLHSRIQNG